jgi:hypothetical protein
MTESYKVTPAILLCCFRCGAIAEPTDLKLKLGRAAEKNSGAGVTFA